MKEAKKVSIGDFERVVKDNFSCLNTSREADWHGVTIVITPTLSIVDMMEFVASVVESCFSDDGDYLPEIRSFAMGKNVLERYANFRMPANAQKCYDLIYRSDAVEFVTEFVNERQLADIESAIDEKINYRLDTMADHVRARLEEFAGAMANLEEQTKHVFDGLSEEDMKKLVGAIEQGGMSEEKLVAAYLDQKKEPEENTEG